MRPRIRSLGATWRTRGGETAVYAGLRLVSGLLSFSLFALIARWYAAPEVKALYYFLFMTGFFLSGLRVFGSVSASLRGDERRTEKLRRVHMAWARVLCGAALLAPLALWILAGPLVPAWSLLVVAVAVMLWGLDADLVRAVVGRGSVVAGAAVCGAALALAGLSLLRSPTGAFTAVLLQWLPLCALQGWLAWRMRRGLRRALRQLWSARAQGLLGVLGVALFDGLVINAPFLLDDRTAPDVGVGIGVATRIFVSSLVLMPLVLHWSNGSALQLLARRLRSTPPRIYAGVCLGSGVLAGTAFAVCFALLAGTPPKLHEALAAALLLLGYAGYASASRYAGSAPPVPGAPSAHRDSVLPWFAVLLPLNLAGVAAMLHTAHPVLAIAAVQAATLLAATGVLLNRRRARMRRLSVPAP